MPSPKHPGKTAAQRRALDEIGCGNYTVIMAKSTRDKLLKDGLIVRCGTRIFGTGPFAAHVAEYQMPIPVHMAWCAAVAEDDPDFDPQPEPRKPGRAA